MKRRVVIRAFTLRRDAGAALLLRDVLRRMNCDSVVACSRNFNTALSRWKPHAVVVNTIGVIEPTRKLAPDAALILWPGEGSEPEASSDATYLLKQPGSFEALDRVLVWGDMTTQHFIRHYGEQSLAKIVKCGNPRLDLLKCNDRLWSGAARGNSIGIVGRFNSINHYDGRPTLYTLTNPANLEPVLAQCRGLVLIVQVIRHLIENTGLTISIRPHPLESPENYKYIRDIAPDRISIDDSIDFANWAGQQRALITPSSTSFVEAYLLRIPMINVDSLQGEVAYFRKRQPFAGLAAECGLAPANFDELVQMLESDLAPPKQMIEIERHLDDGHDWYSPRSAILRAAEATVEAIERKRPNVGRGWPLWLLRLYDELSFRRACARNALHPNFNYKEGYHRTPEHFPRLLENIVADKTVALGKAPPPHEAAPALDMSRSINERSVP